MPDPDPPEQRGSSPNWGAPIVFCALLAAAASHRHSVWGVVWQTLYAAIVLVAAYSTFSPKEFAAEVARRPSTTRAQHYVTLGVPYLLFPVAGWVLAIPLGMKLGVFVPALPWVVLAVVGAFLTLRS